MSNNAGAPRWRDEAAIALVLSALALSLALGGWAWRLDRLLYDAALSLWSRPPPGDTVIVAIDDASVGAIGRWPWPRAVHTTLLTRLAQARPRAVALDLVLSEPDPDPRQDVLLARALADAAPVVLPVSWLAGGGTLRALEPFPALKAVTTLGAAEAAVDSDGVLRHAFLTATLGDQTYPHLALALLRAGGEAPNPALRTDSAPPGPGPGPGVGHRDDRLLIRYIGPPGHFRRISYVDLLTGAAPLQALTGCYVLVGMTAQGLGDTLATPVNARHQAMPGVEVRANTLTTLRSGDSLRAVPGWPVGLGAAMALALLLVGFRHYGPRAALPLALGSVPVAIVASALSLRAGLWWTPVPYALPALLAYPLWSWRRLERAMVGLDNAIVQLGGVARDSSAAAVAVRAGDLDPDDDAVESRLRTLDQAGRLLQQARRFLADALAALPTAVLVADDRGKVLLANPMAAALFEVDAADELQGLDLARLLGEFEAQSACDWPAMLRDLRPEAAPVAMELRSTVAGGLIVHLAAVALQGGRRLVVTLGDIEPVKRAQRQREEVLAFVSHDLRAPASSIVTLADMNLQGFVQMPTTELLQEVRRLAARTLEMSEDFVRTAQVQTRALNPTPVALDRLLDDAVADHRAQALAAGVTLSLQPASDAPVCVDRPLVTRAVGNLVSNAIKHAPAGSAVRLQASLHGAQLQVTVQDAGPGLSAAQLDQLASGTGGARADDPRGVGLGLLFVQRVAQRHRGFLRAGAAEPGPGARFDIVLADQAAPHAPGDAGPHPLA
ncbi:MAG: CHASE2 domain-containing protein [Rubrivivax sp.]|nr:CHASE2 domain-containing protein [Rubrivivax sp.]